MSPQRPTLAQRERGGLVESMRSVGPDAPTLCEGWTTRDLAAHLVVREYRPDAAAGIVVPALADRMEQLRLREAERDWEDLLATISGGAPWYSPLRYADRVANLAEHLVHHEDVRRGTPGWTRRDFAPADLERVWALATTVSRTFLRKVHARVDLRAPAGPSGAAFSPVSTGAALAPLVSISADPVELLLWAFGRDEVEIDVSGAQRGIDALEAVPRGV